MPKDCFLEPQEVRDYCMKFAKITKGIWEDSEDFMPTLQIILRDFTAKKDKDTAHFLGITEFDEGKHALLFSLGEYYASQASETGLPMVVILAAEAWRSKYVEEEWLGHEENRIPPSEDPDREEILLVNGVSIIGLQCATMWKITRGAKNTLSEEQSSETNELGDGLLEEFYKGFAAAYFDG